MRFALLAPGGPVSAGRARAPRVGLPARRSWRSPREAAGPSTLARAGAASPPHPRDSDALRRLPANSPTFAVRPAAEGGGFADKRRKAREARGGGGDADEIRRQTRP